MKFYIVKNSNNKEVVVTEKLEPGEKPSPIHQEMIVPPTFFMQLPSNLLTRLLKNEYNKNLEFKTEHLLRGTHFVDSFRTVHGNSVQKDDILYQTHFDAIPGLARVKVKHVEEYKVDFVNPIYAARVVNGFEKVTVSRNIVGNASFDTLSKAFQDHHHETAALVGYSTYNKRPGMLFIANNVEAARQMLASCEMRDTSPLRQYENWTWYYTYSLSDVMEYIIDLLSSESLLQEMQIISESGEPLNPTTFGPPLITEVAESFQEMGTGASNVGGDTALEFLNIIGSYCDDRKVSVCDLHACHFQNPETRLAEIKFSTDKAYVRSGFCGILGLKSSPEGKMIKAEDLSYLENYLDQRPANAEELIAAIERKFIPDTPVSVHQLYILSPEGLYYVNHRNVITAENLVTNDPQHLNIIADELGVGLRADFRGFKLASLTHAMQVLITDTTNHVREEIDKIFFVNKTTEEATLLNISQRLIAQFDKRMNFSLLNSDKRIFFFNELQWIQKYLQHDFLTVKEEKISAEEEKSEEKTVPVAHVVANINDVLAGAAKKAQLHITMKKYDKYKAIMDSIDSNHHDNVHHRIATSLSQKMFDESIKKRLLEFIKKYRNENIAHEAKRLKRV